jgi:molybdopterin synthase sulfur carrier subunit
MSIAVKFFASLRERYNQSDMEIGYTAGMDVISVWRQVTNTPEMPANILMAVNLEYVDSDHVLKDGDEVAFFPPVTGG